MRALHALVAVVVTGGCNALYGLDHPQLVAADAAQDFDGDMQVSIDAALADGAIDGPPDSAPIVCPSSYATIPGSTTQYRFSAGTASWSNAANDCGNDDPTTHLVVISSLEEYQALADAANGTPFWIGHSDRNVQDMHVWVTVEPVAVPPQWGPNEPNNAGDRCTRFDDGELFDTDCGAAGPYICECDAYANDPSRY